MFWILKQFWTKPIEPDEFLNFIYTNKKGITTSRWVHTKEIHAKHILCWDLRKDAWRSFNQVRICKVKRLNWKKLKKLAGQVGLTLED